MLLSFLLLFSFNIATMTLLLTTVYLTLFCGSLIVESVLFWCGFFLSFSSLLWLSLGKESGDAVSSHKEHYIYVYQFLFVMCRIKCTNRHNVFIRERENSSWFVCMCLCDWYSCICWFLFYIILNFKNHVKEMSMSNKIGELWSFRVLDVFFLGFLSYFVCFFSLSHVILRLTQMEKRTHTCSTPERQRNSSVVVVIFCANPRLTIAINVCEREKGAAKVAIHNRHFKTVHMYFSFPLGSTQHAFYFHVFFFVCACCFSFF